MALQPRQKWMAARIADAFEIKISQAETLLQGQSKRVDELLLGAVQKLFVLYQREQRKSSVRHD